MFCSKCGSNIPDGSTFCGKCGAKLQAPAQPKPVTPAQPKPAAPVQSQPAAPVQPVKKKKKAWPWVLGGGCGCLVLVLILLLVGGLLLMRTPAVQDFMKYELDIEMPEIGAAAAVAKPTYDDPMALIDDYMTYLENADVDGMLSLYADEMVEYCRESSDGDTDENILADYLDDYYDYYGSTVTYYTEYDLDTYEYDEFQNNLEDMLNMENIADVYDYRMDVYMTKPDGSSVNLLFDFDIVAYTDGTYQLLYVW